MRNTIVLYPYGFAENYPGIQTDYHSANMLDDIL